MAALGVIAGTMALHAGGRLAAETAAFQAVPVLIEEYGPGAADPEMLEPATAALERKALWSASAAREQARLQLLIADRLDDQDRMAAARDRLEIALARAPMDGRAWANLARARLASGSDPAAVGAALRLALIFGHADVPYADIRATVGADIRGALDDETRVMLHRDVERLWDRRDRSNGFRRLARSEGGQGLIYQTFLGRPDTLDAITRFLANPA